MDGQLYNVPVVISQAADNYCASSPLVPGCVSAGKTVAQAVYNYQQALRLHLKALVRTGGELPDLSANVVAVDMLPVSVPDADSGDWPQRLRNYRKRQGMTQQELGEKWEYNKATISQWENGQQPIPGCLKAALEIVE